MVYQETSLVPTMTAAQNIELGNEKFFTSYQQAQHPGAAVAAVAELPRRSGDAGRDARHRQAADGRDRPRRLQQRPYHHLRRADGEPDAGRDRCISSIWCATCARAASPSSTSRTRSRRALQISDRITVLRDGKLVITARTAEMTREKLVRHDGRPRHHRRPIMRPKRRPDARSRRRQRGEKVLTVENVTMGSMVKNMSFSVYAGEVVGIAGLIGSGRTEIAKIICGA